MERETYLGDGLYASFDGFQINLRAPRARGDDWVALEPAVWTELLRYINALAAMYGEEVHRRFPGAKKEGQ